MTKPIDTDALRALAGRAPAEIEHVQYGEPYVEPICNEFYEAAREAVPALLDRLRELEGALREACDLRRLRASPRTNRALLPLRERRMTTQQFGSECPECGWRHQVDAFAVGDVVRVLPILEQQVIAPMNEWSRACLVHGGRFCRVVDWRLFRHPPMVRVEFADDDRGDRADFYPCQLEHA